MTQSEHFEEFEKKFDKLSEARQSALVAGATIVAATCNTKLDKGQKNDIVAAVMDLHTSVVMRSAFTFLAQQFLEDEARFKLSAARRAHTLTGLLAAGAEDA